MSRADFPSGIRSLGNAPQFDTAFVTNSLVTDNAAIARTKLEQDDFVEYVVPFTALRVWDNFASLLPASASSDDLGLTFTAGTGIFTDAPTVQGSDFGGTSATQYAALLFGLPPEYVDGQSVRLRIRAAMLTTVADDKCDLDIEAYEHDDDGSLDGSPTDLYTGAVQDMNSLTLANFDFDLTATSLTSGSQLFVRIKVDGNDSGDAGVMIPEITKISFLLDIKG